MSIQEVKKLIKKHGRTMKEFYKFMEGQTVAYTIGGTVRYFDDDVQRFIERKPIGD